MAWKWYLPFRPKCKGQLRRNVMDWTLLIGCVSPHRIHISEGPILTKGCDVVKACITAYRPLWYSNSKMSVPTLGVPLQMAVGPPTCFYREWPVLNLQVNCCGRHVRMVGRGWNGAGRGRNGWASGEGESRQEVEQGRRGCQEKSNMRLCKVNSCLWINPGSWERFNDRGRQFMLLKRLSLNGKGSLEEFIKPLKASQHLSGNSLDNLQK